MTQFLPPSLLQLFQPRPPVPHLPAIDKPPTHAISGVASFLEAFQAPEVVKDQENAQKNIEVPVSVKALRRAERTQLAEKLIEARMREWDPNTNDKATENPYKTLLIARLVSLIA